jgi:hypothetical protein
VCSSDLPGGTHLSTLLLLDAEEPFPIGFTRKAFIHRCAERFTLPGERVVHVGTLWDGDLNIATAMQLREGETLTATGEARGDYGVALRWQGQFLGTFNLYGDAALRTRLILQQGPVVRVIRRGFLLRPDRGRIVVAVCERDNTAR